MHARSAPGSAAIRTPTWPSLNRKPASQFCRPSFFDEVPHLVDLDRHHSRRHLWLRQGGRFGAHPLQYGNVADPQHPADHAEAHATHAIQQHRRRLHRRRLAAQRRVGEVATARPAPISLVATHHPARGVVRSLAPLAAQPIRRHHQPPPGQSAKVPDGHGYLKLELSSRYGLVILRYTDINRLHVPSDLKTASKAIRFHNCWFSYLNYLSYFVLLLCVQPDFHWRPHLYRSRVHRS